VLTLIAERQKKAVMSQQHSGMSAALRFANQMSHQKYHKVPVTEGLSSYKSLTFI